MNNEKPKFFLIFKIIGFIALGIGIFGFIKLITGFGDFDSNNYSTDIAKKKELL